MDIRFNLGTIKFNFRAAGVLIENDHILLHKQQGDRYWALPGGGIKAGEESKDSVVREMKEELGIDVYTKGIPWIAENFFQYKGNPYHELGFYYLLTTERSLFREGAFHGLEGKRLIYQWLPIDQLERYFIQPAFLTAGLKNIPDHTEHLIVNQSDGYNE